MKEIIIGICEDREEDARCLSSALKKAAAEFGKTARIYVYTTGSDFLKEYTPVFDLIFLDVQLPDINGDKIAMELRKRDRRVYLVFVSLFSDSISIGYEYEAKNYLLKPFRYVNIRNELNRYLKYENLNRQQYMLLPNRKDHLKIYFSKLRFIETDSLHRQLIFHYDGECFSHTGKISDFVRMLPQTFFFRCCNSHLVNLLYVSHIAADLNRYSIYLITGEELPLSRDKKKDFLFRLQKAGEYIW